MPESRCLIPWGGTPHGLVQEDDEPDQPVFISLFLPPRIPLQATLQSGHEGRPLLPSRVVRASGGISQFAQHRILPNLVQLPPQEKAVFRKAAGQVSPIGDPWGRRDAFIRATDTSIWRRAPCGRLNQGRRCSVWKPDLKL